MDGSLREPVAQTSTGAVYSLPPAVRTTQRRVSSCQPRLVDRLAETQVVTDIEAVHAVRR